VHTELIRVYLNEINKSNERGLLMVVSHHGVLILNGKRAKIEAENFRFNFFPDSESTLMNNECGSIIKNKIKIKI
jgi:hypothetical protein